MATRRRAPVPTALQKSWLKLEEKVLDFEFQVLNVQFNKVGRYALRLTVENPLLEGSGEGVRLRVNNGESLRGSSGTTDSVEQSNLNDLHAFSLRKFVFTLPQGFCKNDKNHDVRLRIEALRVDSSSVKNSQKVGEAFFAIYPRTNQPRINLLAGKDEHLYHYDDNMALLRVQDDKLAMHCGRLAYSVSFHEYRPPVLKETPSPSRQPSPWPTVSGGNEQHKTQASRAPTPMRPEEVLHPWSSDSTLRLPTLERLLPLPDSHSPPPELQHEQEANALRRDSPEPMSESSDESLTVSSPEPGRSLVKRLPSDASFHLSTPDYSPVPLPPTQTHVIEVPLPENEPLPTSENDNVHVSRPGTELVTIIVHGAANLPTCSNGSIPRPFVTAKTESDKRKKWAAQGVTHACQYPTHSPTWQEKLTLEIDSEDIEHEAVILNVADSETKELLVTYKIPLNYLQPFHHYYLEMVQPFKNSSEVRLYATVIRKGNRIRRPSRFMYTAMEVFLHAVEKPFKVPAGPLIAVARIVPNYKIYQDIMLERPPAASGIMSTTVIFPDPSESYFNVLPVASCGHPQVSSLGTPPEQPVWNYSYLFQGQDGVTLFSEGAALVLEYYLATSMSDMVPWHLQTPLGFSVVPLNQQVYRKLMTQRGQHGIQLLNVPIQGTNLRTTTDTVPTVGISMLLFSSERPDTFLQKMDANILPDTDDKFVDDRADTMEPWVEPLVQDQPETSLFVDEQDHPSFRPRQKLIQPIDVLQKENTRLPSYDAVAEILPNYQLLYRDKNVLPDSQRTAASRKGQPPAQLELTNVEIPSSNLVEKMQGYTIRDHQDRELDNYRTAMQRMADDIITLRKHIVSLETENSQLRSNLTQHQDVGRALLDDTDIDVMTKTEIADRIVSLKHKLASETKELRQMKSKVQQLQNELIRKNDREKDLVLLQRAHQQQQTVLRKYQEKLGKNKALEETIRQQEKVIEMMEGLLNNKLKDHYRGKEIKKSPGGKDDTVQKEVLSTLLAENTRLRGEMERLRFHQAPIVLQQQGIPQDLFPDSEKLSLLAKVEKAKSRIEMLESQLEETARKWGRQKQDLMTRLAEQDHGFARTSTMILHDFPTVNNAESPSNLRRHQKLDPLV
ncbi:coiled-coil domain-containing protein 33 isoform X2 [Rhinatrema bivittatum]|uniref:coiled-coil domain-containing protein 33 isoform X2 n=1 Tax=Rhinatrema bivittatum TaxID=194408 RepID=UPI00112758E2|nr:coiled-coil domain-containing protein 33 isoform X2 [Rhinatrema bivittatum]